MVYAESYKNLLLQNDLTTVAIALVVEKTINPFVRQLSFASFNKNDVGSIGLPFDQTREGFLTRGTEVDPF